ncbi:MAG TPA: AbrB/MazE/SpoVT family DNA-binding domain-containing protein [Dehalococcoidia bacterium]|nr:AbrB/MazE/SpoVT family DNA-binding domain-containing protein [Dehalococcoidia bacterium]
MAQTKERTVVIGEQGRMVIPAAIRRSLALHPGDTLLVRVEDGRLVFEKREQVLARVKRWFAQVAGEESLVDELLHERRAEAAREDAD